MSIDGFGWSWASDSGRINQLRGAFQDLNQTQAAMSSRLSSKLSSLQGSLERRLDALSQAFDAYVELGDVREELRLLPDWSATRSAVQETLGQLTAPGPTQLIDTDEHDHWVAHAMNAVVALTEGGDAVRHEARAAELSDEAGGFIALVSVSIGSGEALRGRLAALFDGATEFDHQQWLLFRAACAGLAGEAELKLLGQRITAQINDVNRWREWLQVSPDHPDGWPRVRGLIDGTVTLPPPEPWDQESLASELSTRAGMLAGAGSRREAQLLRRAGDLRRRIEDPDHQVEQEPQGRGVISAVQEMLIHESVPPQAREIILSWCREPLLAILQGWNDPAAPQRVELKHRARFSPPDAPSRVFDLTVTSRGADLDDLSRIRRAIEQAEPQGTRSSVFFGIAATAAVLGVIGFALGGGWMGLGILLLIAAAVFGYQGVSATRRFAGFRGEQAMAVQRLNTSAAELKDKAIEQEKEREEAMRSLQEEIAQLQREVRALVPGTPSAPFTTADLTVGQEPEPEPTTGPDFRF